MAESHDSPRGWGENFESMAHAAGQLLTARRHAQAVRGFLERSAHLTSHALNNTTLEQAIDTHKKEWESATYLGADYKFSAALRAVQDAREALTEAGKELSDAQTSLRQGRQAVETGGQALAGQQDATALTEQFSQLESAFSATAPKLAELSEQVAEAGRRLEPVAGVTLNFLEPDKSVNLDELAGKFDHLLKNDWWDHKGLGSKLERLGGSLAPVAPALPGAEGLNPTQRDAREDAMNALRRGFAPGSEQLLPPHAGLNGARGRTGGERRAERSSREPG